MIRILWLLLLKIDIGCRVSEISTTVVKPFSSDWNPVYESMPLRQDQVRTIILLVSNTLNPQSFYDALEIQIAVSKFKMPVGATSIIEPEEINDLWLNEEP